MLAHARAEDNVLAVVLPAHDEVVRPHAVGDVVAAERLLPRIGSLLAAARAARVPVVHCTFSMVPDRTSCPLNTPVLRRLAKNPDHMLAGTPLVELCPELGPEPGDLFSDRHHGMSPFIGTGLDDLLRSRGARTVVVTGVSANLGVFGSVIEAVNFGYEVVVEPGAGHHALITDDEYVEAGALVDAGAFDGADLVVSVQPLDLTRARGRRRSMTSC